MSVFRLRRTFAIAALPVGPNATWNGTINSGAGAPSNPTRTTAKPIAHWLQPGEQIVCQNAVIAVCAKAPGGVARVVFSGDCATTTVASETIWTNPSDGTLVPAFQITLNVPAFNAITGGGKGSGGAQIYATIIPNDSSMQSRVIGLTNADLTAVNTADFTQVVYPRTIRSDFDKTIGAGQQYTTLDAFWQAAITANAERPFGTIMVSGNYELTNTPSGYGSSSAALGMGTITHNTGVTATLGRAATINPASSSSWTYRAGWPGIEYRGTGIIFDQNNFRGMVTNKSNWYNGCVWTNSNTNPLYYLNGIPQPSGGGNDSGSPIFPFWSGATVQYSGNLQSLSYLVVGGASQYITGPAFQYTYAIAGTYTAYCDSDLWYGDTTMNPSYTLWYTGAGTPTVSTGSRSTTMTLEVNGTVTHTITIGTVTGTANQSATQLVATINGFGDGWHAALVTQPSWAGSGDGMGVYYQNNLTSATVSTSSGSPTTMTVGVAPFSGMHTDWWFVGSGAGQENCLMINSICRASYWNSEFILGNKLQDVWCYGNVFDASPISGHRAYAGITGVSDWPGSNVSFINNYMFGGYGIQWNSWDSYSQFRNNMISYLTVGDYPYPNEPGTWPTYPIALNNGLGRSWYAASDPNTSQTGASGNFTLTTTSDNSNFNNSVISIPTGDYRPSPTGIQQSYLVVPYHEKYDGRCNLWNQAGDVIGPWANGYGPKSYPF